MEVVNEILKLDIENDTKGILTGYALQNNIKSVSGTNIKNVFMIVASTGPPRYISIENNILMMRVKTQSLETYEYHMKEKLVAPNNYNITKYGKYFYLENADKKEFYYFKYNGQDREVILFYQLEDKLYVQSSLPYLNHIEELKVENQILKKEEWTQISSSYYGLLISSLDLNTAHANLMNVMAILKDFPNAPAISLYNGVYVSDVYLHHNVLFVQLRHDRNDNYYVYLDQNRYVITSTADVTTELDFMKLKFDQYTYKLLKPYAYRGVEFIHDEKIIAADVQAGVQYYFNRHDDGSVLYRFMIDNRDNIIMDGVYITNSTLCLYEMDKEVYHMPNPDPKNIHGNMDITPNLNENILKLFRQGQTPVFCNTQGSFQVPTQGSFQVPSVAQLNQTKLSIFQLHLAKTLNLRAWCITKVVTLSRPDDECFKWLKDFCSKNGYTLDNNDHVVRISW